MTEASLALQKAIRARLVADPVVSELVAPAQIVDRNTRPEIFPTIVLGEDQTALEPITFRRRHVRVFSTLHVWHRESGLTGSKTIAGAVRTALSDLELPVEYRLVDLEVQSARFLRDPGGEHSHAVVTVEALLEEAP